MTGKDIVEDKPLNKPMFEHDNSYTSELRFSDEAGFSECLSVSSVGCDFKWRVPLPEDARLIQLMPALEWDCIVKNLKVSISGQPINMKDNSGDNASQFEMFVEAGQSLWGTIPISFVSATGRYVDICGNIYIINEDHLIALSRKYSGLQKKHDQLEKNSAALQDNYCAQIETLDAESQSLRERLNYLKQQESLLKEAIESIDNSNSWKLTAPFRYIKKAFKRVVRDFSYAIPVLRRAYKYLAAVYRFGSAEVRFNKKRYGTPTSPPLKYIPGKTVLEKQKEESFQSISISICVPLYNTKPNHLKDMLNSVIYQSYPFWELCLADASDEEHSYVGRFVNKLAKKDSRIKYTKLDENFGIAGNTNEAIKLATGQFIGLLDHDDILNHCALYEVQRTISATEADFLYTDELTFRNDDIADIVNIHCKPDFAIDTFRGNNYLCHFSIFSRKLLQTAGGGMREGFDGSQDYELFLRLVEKADTIVHIPKILYFWRSHENSVAQNINAKFYALTAAKKALGQHFMRCGIPADVELIPHVPSIYRIRYALKKEPLVSIIIPNKDNVDTLRTCVRTILRKTTYSNYEIIIADNNSNQPSTWLYYDELKDVSNIKITLFDDSNSFNFSAINNNAVKYSEGEYFIFLNNDTEVISSNWIEEMLMYAQRDDVGAVGAKLYYPDDTLQHGGLVLGMLELAGHAQKGLPRFAPGYFCNLRYARNVSCVTGACIMVSRTVFKEIDGFNEKFAVAFNDVDFCMRIRELGYLIVWTPYAELYHYESKTREDDMSIENRVRFSDEIKRFQAIWGMELAAGDPYFNPNLRLDTTDYVVKE